MYNDNNFNLQGGPSNTSLYYRKAGYGPDGWVIGMGLDQISLVITTNDTSYCPDQVTSGYYLSSVDSEFLVTCDTASDLYDQDPGIPAAPLAPLPPERALSGGARDTLTSSLCFR